MKIFAPPTQTSLHLVNVVVEAKISTLMEMVSLSVPMSALIIPINDSLASVVVMKLTRILMVMV